MQPPKEEDMPSKLSQKFRKGIKSKPSENAINQKALKELEAKI